MAHGYEFRVDITESLELSGELENNIYLENEYDFVFICFENGNRGSFMYARYISKQLMKKYKIPFLLIQTKTDVVVEDNFDKNINKFCHRYGIGLVRLSSKFGYDIDQPWLFCFRLLTGNQNIDLLRLSLVDNNI
uniref:Uncharacterized protein n=1 Tax=viral metagenome TaxID=1070528 RepID=A0A6C0JQZ9_9ZZZZ